MHSIVWRQHRAMGPCFSSRQRTSVGVECGPGGETYIQWRHKPSSRCNSHEFPGPSGLWGGSWTPRPFGQSETRAVLLCGVAALDPWRILVLVKIYRTRAKFRVNPCKEKRKARAPSLNECAALWLLISMLLYSLSPVPVVSRSTPVISFVFHSSPACSG